MKHQHCPQLFKRWITLATSEKKIYLLDPLIDNDLSVRQIFFYPVDSVHAIQHLNNQGQVFKSWISISNGHISFQWIAQLASLWLVLYISTWFNKPSTVFHGQTVLLSTIELQVNGFTAKFLTFWCHFNGRFKSIYHGKWLVICFFNNIAVDIFLCPFSLTPMGKSCMQKENLYHHHIIFMVCTCIDHSSQPISTQEITQLLYTVIYPMESVIQP